MDEPFDFRPYIEALLKRGYLLLGGTILAAVLAVGLSYLLPPTYEAHTLVLIVDPNQLIQFDPRFETIDEIRPRQAYPVLAQSDHLLQTLLQSIAAEVDDPDTLIELQDSTTVSTNRAYPVDGLALATPH